MRPRVPLIALVGATVRAPAAGAKLTPEEQTWVTPLPTSRATSRLQDGITSLYRGRAQLAKAYEAITKLGRSSSLSA